MVIMRNLTEEWSLCEQANYSPPENGVSDGAHVIRFGDEYEGDFGFLKLDHVNKVAYLAFRGSDDKLDWISNADQRPNDKGYHTGFYEGAERFIDVYGKIPEGYKIKIQGHSRGGALSLLSSVIIYMKAPLKRENTIEIETFGCPQVTIPGTPLYNLIKSGKITHNTTTNGMDIVPELPSTLTRQMAGERKKDIKKTPYVQPATSHTIIGKRLTGWKKKWFNFNLAFSIFKAIKSGDTSKIDLKYGTDHHPDSYTASLKAKGMING